MPNYLGQIIYNFKKARDELEAALRIIEGKDGAGSKVQVTQHMNITDELAEVFKDKPVIIMQTMDVRILQINNQIQAALRALDRIDSASLRAIGTVKPTRRDKAGRFKEITNGGS